MIERLFLRLVAGGLVGILIGVITDIRIENEGRSNKSRKFKVPQYFQSDIIPFFIGASFLLYCFLSGMEAAVKNLSVIVFNLACCLSLYYVLLMLLLPFMRRRFNARICGLMWIMPNIIYAVFDDKVNTADSLLMLHLPEKGAKLLFFIWLIGFAVIMGGKILSHFKFKRMLLDDSENIADPEILAVFQKVKDDLDIPDLKLQLAASCHIKTPLSISLTPKKYCVVLPVKEYSKEDLNLIFHHELVHILRKDAGTKFFLEFCKAVCWFNPLVLLAMKKSADDLELSCDETVLIQCGTSSKDRYAELILNTAGNECGFTTCLSASSSSLRYRLKCIMKPQKKHTGALMIALCIMLLFLSTGHVVLTLKETSGKEGIYQSEDPALYSLKTISLEKSAYDSVYICPDEEKLHELLISLSMEEVINDCDISDEGQKMLLEFESPKGGFSLIFAGKYAAVRRIQGDMVKSSYYYLPDDIWDRLNEVLLEYPAMNAVLVRESDGFESSAHATLWKLTQKDETIPAVQHKEMAVNRIMRGDEWTKKIRLDFSASPVSKVRIEIQSWDQQHVEYIEKEASGNSFIFDKPQYPAHYIVYAEFIGEDGLLYHAEFRFDCFFNE